MKRRKKERKKIIQFSIFAYFICTLKFSNLVCFFYADEFFSFFASKIEKKSKGVVFCFRGP